MAAVGISAALTPKVKVSEVHDLSYCPLSYGPDPKPFVAMTHYDAEAESVRLTFTTSPSMTERIAVKSPAP